MYRHSVDASLVPKVGREVRVRSVPVTVLSARMVESSIRKPALVKIVMPLGKANRAKLAIWSVIMVQSWIKRRVPALVPKKPAKRMRSGKGGVAVSVMWWRMNASTMECLLLVLAPAAAVISLGKGLVATYVTRKL